MKKRTYTVRFITPAFLGNANQDGQWRTPPFKHLLREWWRVAWAGKNDPADWRRMREVEGYLFGHAWLENDRDGHGKKVSARKSRVLLRLSSWNRGGCNSLPALAKVASDRNSVSSDLYLGYGPVAKAGRLKNNVAVGEGENATLSLAYPGDDEVDQQILLTLALINRFGTVGGRSRNGWGSVCFEPDEGQLPLLDEEAHSRDWHECLQQEWPHAIGWDDRGLLLWQSDELNSWTKAMELLGTIRKQVNALDVDRLLLNQPVGRKGKRIPSSLRFKVIPAGEGRLRATVFHMPCTPPDLRNTRKLEQTWRKVHAFLDDQRVLRRSRP